jgi:two-component system chemotaxis response regulator CheY
MSKPLVIFIDDSETALASTRVATNDMEIDVKQYLSAVEAVNELRSGAVSPDLIITDLNMPEMNGFEFLEAIREISSVSRIPTLMLTTESSPEMKQRGKALGLTGWIVKPFNTKQLKQAISRVLRLG